MRYIVILLLAGTFVGSANAEQTPHNVIHSFLKAHCLRCHGSTVQKADRRFDMLVIPARDLGTAESLQEILDQLNLGAMPPEDQQQPDENELKHVVEHLSDELSRYRREATDNSGKAVLRRLNRNEYRNTIRDLFHLRMVDFDPTTGFPADESTAGFDNVGQGLVTSDALLTRYLEAAREVADKVVQPGPRPAQVLYEAGIAGGGNEATGTVDPGNADKDARAQAGRLFIKFRQPLGISTLDRKRGVPADGEYLIRLSARAVRRKSRYRDEDLKYDSDEPMRLSLSIDSRELGPTAHRVIGEYPIPDDRAIEIEHRVWLEKGFTFHVHWANGPDGSFKRILRKVLPKYNKDALFPIRNPPEMYIGSGPELHVDSLSIEGPIYEEWPPTGFARFFPDPPETPAAKYLDESLLRLADVAYRRPVDRTEIEPYLGLARRYLSETGDFWAAARYGIRAILTSPSFLYLVETDPNDASSVVSDHELASRLSYFLWSSMPDVKLRAAADSGSLSDSSVLRDQVERMLSDPKAAAFAQNFAGQWLGLRRLGEMPPDPEKNPSYYKDDLENAMRQETLLFFRHVLNSNRSILEFVDSDYTFLNSALAKHYGISRVDHPEFRKVRLLPDDHRGGVLGHAGVLTATSNGVESQPVVRGVWVLNNLLGTPPQPPPPDIEPIEPDTRGVSTIRQLMEKHRNNPTCFECHRKIDPIGLALERFDHVGAWRDRYQKHLPIDASGELPDGTQIDGSEGIKSFLLARPQQFSRCLTEKVLVYALGRELSFVDRNDVDRIVDALPENSYRFRDLIQMIVASKAFHSK